MAIEAIGSEIGKFGRRRVLALLMLVALLAVRAWDPWPVEALRLKVFDQYQQLVPGDELNSPVTLVAIDEASLASLGQWPWPRNVLADIFRRIGDSGAAAIGVDIVFPEPDRTSPSKLAQHLPTFSADLKRQLALLPSNDEILAGVLKTSRVVLGRAVASGMGAANTLAHLTPVAEIGGSPLPYLPQFDDIIANLNELSAAAAGRGVITVVPELDGVVRRLPAVVGLNDKILPSLTIEMLRVATGSSAIAVRSDQSGVTGVVVGNVLVPTDRDGRIWVRFAARHNRDLVSAVDVFEGRFDPAVFTGRLVLLGAYASALGDIKATPLNIAMFGVDIHAQMLETILTQTGLKRPPYALGAELSLILVTGLILVIVIPFLRGKWTVILGLAVGALVAATSWWLFLDERTLIDWSYPAGSLIVVYTMLVYTGYIEEERSKQQVRGAFSQYLSPALVEQLAHEPDLLKLGGEVRQMTFLFCDVRGFTSISEGFKGDPQGLTTLINRFLTPMTDAILARGGTIDKYMGDCIMAFWNAPLDDPLHAEHACQSALAMFEELRKLNEQLVTEAAAEDRKPLPLAIGIGLNSGECVVGNMGSQQRFDYSVLGDAVNLAARLEGQSKNYGVGIVIGEETQREAKGYATVELDLIAVKGKREAVRIFALLGDESVSNDGRFAELIDRHTRMLAAFRRQDWDRAAALIKQCREWGDDLEPLYDLYDVRVDYYRENPPDPDWDGVFVASTK